MAFRATLEMDDSMNRTVSKSLECEATVLATAITDVDAGATFRLRTTLGEVVSYKIPGFKQSLADGNGQIDPAGAEVVAYFANFLAAGAFTLSKGDTIVAILSGAMDQ